MKDKTTEVKSKGHIFIIDYNNRSIICNICNFVYFGYLKPRSLGYTYIIFDNMVNNLFKRKIKIESCNEYIIKI
jgi:hypothetical protein